MAARERNVAAPRAAGWSNPAFGRVAEVVHLVSGLVFPSNRQPSAEAGMRRAMASLRIADPIALAEAVQRPGAARDFVLAELTVGETYFFRESGPLELLRTDILPALTARHGADAPLRIWSAGCASGEEPYSIAILLRELGWPHPARILGTDVAIPRLDAARRGRYTKWSLRGVSAERVERWFTPESSHFQLDESIRAAVQFAPLNFVTDDYPSAATGTTAQDVVLCRNVLIYFDMESVARIAQRLLASLAPDGWLLLGASDPPLADLVACEATMTPNGFVYRRADRDPSRARRATPLATPITAPQWSPSPASTWLTPVPGSVRAQVAAARPEVAGLDVDIPPAFGREPPPADAGPIATTRTDGYSDAADLATWVQHVRSLANEGRLREADEHCMRALDQHRDSPELHYLHATLLTSGGQYREAANAARRALYLDRQYVMAHLQLGDALARDGDADRAVRAFTNALHILVAASDDAPVPAADGVAASRLRHVAEQRVRALGERAG